MWTRKTFMGLQERRIVAFLSPKQKPALLVHGNSIHPPTAFSVVARSRARPMYPRGADRRLRILIQAALVLQALFDSECLAESREKRTTAVLTTGSTRSVRFRNLLHYMGHLVWLRQLRRHISLGNHADETAVVVDDGDSP